MLSTSVIKNVGQASHYYSEVDNYYTRDEGIEQSEWWGKGAKKLQLSGVVDEKQFISLLEGKLPSGEQLGKVVEGEIKHRPGWDLTLSAPKSVSMMAYIGGDKRLIEAHREAVLVTLGHIERSAAQARVNTPEGISYQNTGNLIAALYHHDLSRAKDPQMHTHAVVMNITERTDGKLRSLASQIGRYDEKSQGEINGFIERVRHFNRYLSKVYEAEMAYKVKQLGYEITTETESGIFEIAGVSPDAIQSFSKRRQQIKNQLEKKGLSGGKAAAMATFVTRSAKDNIDRTELKEQWLNDARDIKFDHQIVLDNSLLKNKTPSNDLLQTEKPDHRVLEALDKASKSLSIFKTTFTVEEMIFEASEYVIRHGINMDSLLSGIDKNIERGELILVSEAQGKTVLMSKATLDDEKRLITQLKDNKLSRPFVKNFHLTNYLAQHEEVNLDLHDHLKTIFGNDRIVLLEGESTKDALIESIIKISKSASLEVAILSPSLLGSRQFAKEVKLAPQTFWEKIKDLIVDTTPRHGSVMQFLSRFSEGASGGKVFDMLIVDNAHLLSTHQKAKLTEWNKIHDTKLILLGNKNTLLPQQTGASLQQVTEHGVKSISIPSKKNSIVNSLAINQLSAAIDKMRNRIIAIDDRDDRHHAMVKHYARLNDTERRNSWLVGQNKSVVEALNVLAHNQLKANNQINQTIKLNLLIPVFLAQGKATLASSYQKNYVVRFNETYSSLNVDCGEYLRVIQHNEKSNRVVLQKADGKKVIWQPERVAGASGKIELFNQKEREVGVGESLIFHRSIKPKQIIKGERFTVLEIRQQKIKLKNSEGKSVVIDTSYPNHRHVDYGYAATLHAIAREKPIYLIAELPVKSFSTDQRQFYQAITQPKEAWIYTDHQQGLAALLEKKSGDRLTVHETLAKADEITKNLHSFYEVLEKHIAEKTGNNNKLLLVRDSIKAVEYAMNHLAEREAGFTHKQLMHVAMEHALGSVTQEMLTEASIAMKKEGILLHGHRSDGTLWTTADAVKMEREILALVDKDKGKLQPIASNEILAQYCDPNTLTPEQFAAIKTITQSENRVLSIQGRAGTGKTTMLVTLDAVLSAKELLSGNGYTLQGIAPTHKAVKELTERGITAQTVDSFLLDMLRIQENRIEHDFSKTILVVDEASMVSNRKMLAVLNVAHDLNFREVIPTGDTEQNPSIEAGKPHELIQHKLDTTIYLKNIQRQKNPILKQTVQAIYQSDVAKTFSILDNSIIEIKHKENNSDENKEIFYQQRVKAIVTDYISLVLKDENVQMIASSHKERKAVNAETRLQLDEMNLLKGDAHSFSVFSSKNMTGVERTKAMNFKPGDILRFAVSSGKAIKSGDYLIIKSINKEHNILTLSSIKDSNKEIIWQVPRAKNSVNNTVEVFKREERTLKVGDKIVWVRSNRKEGILSAEFSKVTHIEQGMITVNRPDKSVLTFNGHDEKYQHWDHGYAVTAYGAQGGTYSTVLGIFESYRKKLMNMKNFLVTITRAENTLRIYTDDKDKLQRAIQQNMGNKLSSLEVIGEFPRPNFSKEQQKELPSSDRNTTQQYEKPKAVKRTVIKEKLNKETYFDKHTVEQIKEGLNRDAENIAIDTLGTPKIRGSNFLKFCNNQGSLSVTTKGERQGWWNDFSDKGGRGMLSFIQKYVGLEKRQAIEYGAKWLGISPKIDDKNERPKTNIVMEKAGMGREKQGREQKKRNEFAKKLADQSQSIKGTLAEKYLHEHRAIVMETYPDDIRFHPGIYSKLNGKTLPAMLVVARDKSGHVQAVQATYLDKDTAKKIDKSIAEIQKQTFGSLQGATVNIQGEKGAPTLIAEGIETGLSLAVTIEKVNVKITLGKSNFKNLDIKSLTEKVIFCLDNDGNEFKIDKVIAESSKRLVEHNKQVTFMLPTALTDPKQDYNDILKSIGKDAIKDDYEKQISYKDMYEITQDRASHNPVLNHRNTFKREINGSEIHVKIRHNQHLLPAISDKMIIDFSKESIKNIRQKDMKHIDAYKAIRPQNHNDEMTKTNSKHKDVEREI